jgi:hypothetical protein
MPRLHEGFQSNYLLGNSGEPDGNSTLRLANLDPTTTTNHRVSVVNSFLSVIAEL